MATVDGTMKQYPKRKRRTVSYIDLLPGDTSDESDFERLSDDESDFEDRPLIKVRASR